MNGLSTVRRAVAWIDQTHAEGLEKGRDLGLTEAMTIVMALQQDQHFHNNSPEACGVLDVVVAEIEQARERAAKRRTVLKRRAHSIEPRSRIAQEITSP